MNQNILKKLSIINSSKEHNVELALIDKIISARKEVEARSESALNEAKVFEAKFNDLKKKLDADSKYVEKLYTEARNSYQDVRDKAKELGLDIPKEWDKEMDLIRTASSKIPTTNLGNIFPILLKMQQINN